MKKHIVGICLFLLCGIQNAHTSPVNEKEALQLTLAGEDDWYPYTAFKDGKLRGFSVDIIESAYAAVNVKVRFKSVPYARCLMLAETGQELGCFNSMKNDKLSKTLLFHQDSTFKVTLGIYARSDSSKQSITASMIKDKLIGVTHGYSYTDKIDGNTAIRRERAPTDLSNLRKLLLKRSDYSLISTRVFDYLVTKYPEEFKDKIQQIGVVGEIDQYVSFSKKRAEATKFANLLDEGLQIIRKNGEYARIEHQWRTPKP